MANAIITLQHIAFESLLTLDALYRPSHAEIRRDLHLASVASVEIEFPPNLLLLSLDNFQRQVLHPHMMRMASWIHVSEGSGAVFFGDPYIGTPESGVVDKFKAFDPSRGLALLAVMGYDVTRDCHLLQISCIVQRT